MSTALPEGHVWARNTATDAVAPIPEAAIPQLRQSGWEPLSKKDVAALEKAAADELAADEQAMRDVAAAGALTPEAAAADPAPAPDTSSTKENG